MPITALPPAPSRNDPANFATKADAWVAALDLFTSEANTLETTVNANAASANTAAFNALAASNSANSTANVTRWVSGTSYTSGDNVYSPTTYLTYRRKTNGAGTTDPSSDSTNWIQIAGTGNVSTDVSGNLGLGTGTPSVKLHVVASTPASSPTWFSADSVVVSTTSTGVVQLHAGTTGGTIAYAFSTGTTRSNAAMAYDTTGGYLYFTTNTGNERMRIDQTGNVGIGATSPTARLHVAKDDTVGTQIVRIQNSNLTRYSSAMEFTSSPGADWRIGKGAFSQDQDFSIGLTSGTEFLRLSATGNLLVGTQSMTFTGNGFGFTPTSAGAYGIIGHATGVTTGSYYLGFQYNGTTIGGITQSGTTAVAYNTSSDYRLKVNVRPADAKRFMDIKFRDFEWIDGRHDCGVIAHELAEVYPDLVVGKKDAKEIRKVEISPAIPAVLDDKGNEISPAIPAVTEYKEVPVYQSVNYIGLIARMGTVVQQQQSKISSLEDKLVAQQLVIDDLINRISTLESK